MGMQAVARVKNGARSGIVWMAWERHRRTLELCRFLGVQPVIFTSSLPRWSKHPWFLLRSLAYILKSAPRTLIVQNPSIFLTLAACLAHRCRRFRLIVDTHNAGIAPEDPLLARLTPLYRFFQREADVTIVTNEELAGRVRRNGGRPFVLPDLLPEPPATRKTPLRGRINIVFICTFGEDEPYREMFSAARRLPADIHLYVTGNPRKAPPQLLENLPAHLTLTGFLPELEYWTLLASADLAVDLTRRDNCLVCGAYEAVAVGTPLILSDFRPLREYFRRGTVFVANDAEAIRTGILVAIDRLPELRAEIRGQKEEIEKEWRRKGGAFSRLVEGSLA
jgi:glycosyltransferase involved in cell wall biosynthesis